ncbi:MAG TPA: hypothetical protein V6D26_09940 [Stenomitos sp.]
MTTTTHNKQTKDILDWLEFLIETYLEDNDQDFFRETDRLYDSSGDLGNFAKRFCKRFQTETEAWEFPRNLRDVNWIALGQYIESKVIDR